MATKEQPKRLKRSLVFLIGILVGVFITYFYFLPSNEGALATGEVEGGTGPSVEILVDEDYFPKVIELIRNADESLYVGEFELKQYDKYKNSYSNQLLDALIDAHQRGVEVHVIADQFYSVSEAIEYLQKAGVDARFDSETRTMHSKFIVIDGEIVVVGSTNWSYYSMTKNNEANVIIRSKELASEFIAYFRTIQ